jgi:hypothetical protein
MAYQEGEVVHRNEQGNSLKLSIAGTKHGARVHGPRDEVSVIPINVPKWGKCSITNWDVVTAFRIDSRQQQAAERWKSRQQNGPPAGQGVEPNRTHSSTHQPDIEGEKKIDRTRDGPEEDLEP